MTKPKYAPCRVDPARGTGTRNWEYEVERAGIEHDSRDVGRRISALVRDAYATRRIDVFARRRRVL